MKLIKIILMSFFLIGISTSANAQFWKKLKEKAQEKLEKKVENETDKIIDSTLNGKKAKKEKIKNKEFKSSGVASISHSNEFGMVNINKIAKTVVTRKGNSYRIIGNWVTTDVDVFDGFVIDIKNVESLDELNTKSFKIPDEAILKFGYETQQKDSYKGESSGKGQSYDLKSGTISLNFQKDKSVSFNFSGNADLTVGYTKDNYGDYTAILENANVSGNAIINNPEYRIAKEINKNQKTTNNTISNAYSKKILNKASPTVNIPSTFSFNKSISVEMTDSKGDKFPMEFLLGNYPDIYALSVASKEMQGQGAVTMVMTPKSSTAFMDVGGMKMKRSTSLEQMGNQYNITDKLPDGADFEYKKTGNTKTILGYTCEEYKVDYNYTNSQGSASFWVSKDFPIQNVEMPMLGMKMNNPYLKGFVMELNSTHQGQNWIIKVTDVSDKTTVINTNEYKKMGF